MAERNKMFFCVTCFHIFIYELQVCKELYELLRLVEDISEKVGGGKGWGGVGKKKPVIYKSLAIYETKYSRIDQVKYVEYSL